MAPAKYMYERLTSKIKLAGFFLELIIISSVSVEKAQKAIKPCPHPASEEADPYARGHIIPHRGHITRLHPTCKGYLHVHNISWPTDPWSKEVMSIQDFTPYNQKQFSQSVRSNLGSPLIWMRSDVSCKGQRAHQQISSRFPAEDSPAVP